MQRAHERRLGRVLAPIRQADRAAADYRNALRARAAIGAVVRWSLAQRGIDPTRAVMLCVADEAASELAAMGDTQELRKADQEIPEHGDAAPPDEDDWLDDGTRRLIERYRSGQLREPDLAQASLAELFAWCIASPASAGPTPGLSTPEDNLGVQVCC